MPSRSVTLRWFLWKEWHELLVSRAWWVLLLAMGPLSGVSFISAVTTYGELSGLNGTSAGVGEAFTPLAGIWAPTFSACELAAAFLLPFVAIRLVAGDRQSGALKIEMQHPAPAIARVFAKTVVLLVGWAIATLAPLLGVALWASYGGHLNTSEITVVLFGHVLNAGLTIALAFAAAAVADHPSTAAILTLTVTVGTWILNFMAAVHGGWWEAASGYTPTAMVAEFQRGLIRADVVLVAIALIVGGLVLSSIWLRTGAATRLRLRDSLVLAVTVVLAIAAAAQVSRSWDLSENRANSFSRADEAALRSIASPLRIEAHLAPEDPRRSDLEHRALSRLQRLLPATEVRYVSATSVGLFEQTADQYGEIWYELDGRRVMSRGTTSEVVLETIYDLARLQAPDFGPEDVFRGYPLAARPRGAPVVFYLLWPAAIAAAGLMTKWRRL